MKTIKTTRVETELSRLEFGYWDLENDEFIPIRSEVDIVKAAELFGVNPLLVEALITLIDGIKDFIGADLKDIWEIVADN